MISNILLRPNFYDCALNGNRYLEFLNIHFQNYWETLSSLVVKDMYIQKNRALPLNSRAVKRLLNNTFNSKWIGICVPVK
ncbi:hypothetical protein WH47_01665 [Habropoda laboriosa]|uniref:Histone-lysine N-methyltransferase SETMAR n=1 Tax=Habropoda laboriosa TaxID=597456 RepID=A0A0L7R413_9HYME|nr:hypothetical protein WH47_01665 [Habropoda laboriosa]